MKLWIDTPLFEKDPFPKDKDEYMQWIQRNLEFVERRNRRIEAFLSTAECCDHITSHRFSYAGSSL